MHKVTDLLVRMVLVLVGLALLALLGGAAALGADYVLPGGRAVAWLAVFALVGVLVFIEQIQMRR